MVHYLSKDVIKKIEREDRKTITLEDFTRFESIFSAVKDSKIEFLLFYRGIISLEYFNKIGYTELFELYSAFNDEKIWEYTRILNGTFSRV